MTVRSKDNLLPAGLLRAALNPMIAGGPVYLFQYVKSKRQAEKLGKELVCYMPLGEDKKSWWVAILAVPEAVLTCKEDTALYDLAQWLDNRCTIAAISTEELEAVSMMENIDFDGFERALTEAAHATIMIDDWAAMVLESADDALMERLTQAVEGYIAGHAQEEPSPQQQNAQLEPKPEKTKKRSFGSWLMDFFFESDEEEPELDDADLEKAGEEDGPQGETAPAADADAPLVSGLPHTGTAVPVVPGPADGQTQAEAFADEGIDRENNAQEAQPTLPTADEMQGEGDAGCQPQAEEAEAGQGDAAPHAPQAAAVQGDKPAPEGDDAAPDQTAPDNRQREVVLEQASSDEGDEGEKSGFKHHARTIWCLVCDTFRDCPREDDSWLEGDESQEGAQPGAEEAKAPEGASIGQDTGMGNTDGEGAAAGDLAGSLSCAAGPDAPDGEAVAQTQADSNQSDPSQDAALGLAPEGLDASGAAVMDGMEAVADGAIQAEENAQAAAPGFFKRFGKWFMGLFFEEIPDDEAGDDTPVEEAAGLADLPAEAPAAPVPGVHDEAYIDLTPEDAEAFLAPITPQADAAEAAPAPVQPVVEELMEPEAVEPDAEAEAFEVIVDQAERAVMGPREKVVRVQQPIDPAADSEQAIRQQKRRQRRESLERAIEEASKKADDEPVQVEEMRAFLDDLAARPPLPQRPARSSTRAPGEGTPKEERKGLWNRLGNYFVETIPTEPEEQQDAADPLAEQPQNREDMRRSRHRMPPPENDFEARLAARGQQAYTGEGEPDQPEDKVELPRMNTTEWVQVEGGQSFEEVLRNLAQRESRRTGDSGGHGAKDTKQ
nr:hypothetical protein [bacterium]